MKSKDEIFKGKSFEDLTKDIYDNQHNKKLQLDLLIQEIHGFIQTIDDVVMVAPLVKELYEVLKIEITNLYELDDETMLNKMKD